MYSTERVTEDYGQTIAYVSTGLGEDVAPFDVSYTLIIDWPAIDTNPPIQISLGEFRRDDTGETYVAFLSIDVDKLARLAERAVRNKNHWSVECGGAVKIRTVYEKGGH